MIVDGNDAPVTVPALKVSAIDTTGAGDAVNGILVAELARGAPLVEAVRLAVIGASLSTLKPGARGGLPTRAEIQKAL
jgi:ribokinase